MYTLMYFWLFHGVAKGTAPLTRTDGGRRKTRSESQIYRYVYAYSYTPVKLRAVQWYVYINVF